MEQDVGTAQAARKTDEMSSEEKKLQTQQVALG